jgi:pantothenate synthetase
VIQAAAKKVLAATEGFETDYVAVVHPETLEPVTEIGAMARVLVAGAFGKGSKRVRLIDNGPLFPVSARML